VLRPKRAVGRLPASSLLQARDAGPPARTSAQNVALWALGLLTGLHLPFGLIHCDQLIFGGVDEAGDAARTG
jgi:hypothetical protein